MQGALHMPSHPQGVLSWTKWPLNPQSERSALSEAQKASISTEKNQRLHLWAGRDFKEHISQPVVLQRKRPWPGDRLSAARVHTVMHRITTRPSVLTVHLNIHSGGATQMHPCGRLAPVWAASSLSFHCLHSTLSTRPSGDVG